MKKLLLATAITALGVGVSFATAGTAQAHSYNYGSYGQGSGWSSGWSGNGAKDVEATGTIAETLANDQRFTTLVAAAQTAGLADALNAPGEMTVFAPTNRAFDKLPAGTVESLLANPAALKTVLLNHVVAGNVDADTANYLGEAKTLSGNTLNIGYGDDGYLYVNDSRITVQDVWTTNGVIHVIDAVLVP